MPNLPYLDGVDLAAITAHVVAVGNDAHFALLAEATEGAAFERTDALLLAIGTGIGSAVLSDGRIVRGSHGAAASFGWACADVADPGDDRHGWLERHAAGPVLDAAGAAMTPPVDGRGLVAAAVAGDAAARAAIDRVGTTLGTALAGAVALLDPGLVIISGGLADAVDALAPSLRAALLSPAAGAPARHRGRERRTRAIGRVDRCPRGGAARSGLVAGERLMATMTRPDRRRPEPLWHQVEQSIRAAIDSGTWKAGARLPGEDQLTDLLGVSRITVRHALANLETAGILRREHGRGTFVRSARLVAGTRALTSFSEEMSALGLDVATRLLDVRRIKATGPIAEALEIDEGSAVVRLRRLRFGGGQPIGVQAAHLRGDRVDGLTAADVGDGSLYTLLRERYGIHPALAEEVYRVAGAGRRDAELLGIAPRRRRVLRRADHQRRPRPVRVHAVDDARRPLRDPLVAARHLITTHHQQTKEPPRWPTTTCTASSS